MLLSDGIDLGASVHGLSSAIEAAQSADVSVYTIRYLSGTYLALDWPLAPRALLEHGMADIASETGGLAFHNPRNLDQVYALIDEDLRSQCVLAYEPKRPAAGGAWHRLEIVTTRPGVKVRAQAGYREIQ